MNGVTYIEINYDSAWVENSIAKVQGFSWLFEWGMYIFLFLTLAIMFWIFYDSITKKKDEKALVPRILSMVGFFCIIPSFIFRFVGTADGVTSLVKLNAETGAPYYAGAINWNVGWLVAGYGPVIAIIALIGVVLSIAAIVIYASSVQRAKVDTMFVNRVSNLEDKVDQVNRNINMKAHQASSPLADAMASSGASKPASNQNAKTVFDRKPAAATIIDTPKTGDSITVQDDNGRGRIVELPGNDVVIGRDSKNFIVINDGKVSGTHMKLSYVQGSWSIGDLGSTNGTYVNGIKIVGQQQLSNGDKIRVGNTTLVFSSTNQ